MLMPFGAAASSGKNVVWMFSSTLHRQALVENADHAVVVLDGDRGRRHLARRFRIAAAAARRQDVPPSTRCVCHDEVAAARRQVAVGTAFEQRRPRLRST